MENLTSVQNNKYDHECGVIMKNLKQMVWPADIR